MFFFLSKTAAFLALPSNLFIAAGIAGLVLWLTRFKRTGRALAAASLILLALAGFSPLGGFLSATLEDRFPPWDSARGAPTGIIVLGGAISPELSQARGEAVLTSSAERITAAGKLAQQYPSARVIYTGGNGSLIPGGPAETDFVLPVFEKLNVARERVLLEGKSRNTAENAAFTRELLNPKPGERWLLVTSASHMPRAIGSFRRAGFAVEAYPVDRRAERGADMFRFSHTLSGGLLRTDQAMREWIGLLAYWISGRSSELFPAPN